MICPVKVAGGTRPFDVITSLILCPNSSRLAIFSVIYSADRSQLLLRNHVIPKSRSQTPIILHICGQKLYIMKISMIHNENVLIVCILESSNQL